VSGSPEESRRPLAVVPDTSALQAEGWDLASEPMRIVEHECARGGFALYLPEVVVREMKAHGGEAARKAASRHNQDVRILWQLGELTARPESLSLRTAYGPHLDERLADFHATMLAMPTVGHAELVERALLLRKPFREKGTGYKDALIWHSILELLPNIQLPLAFVAADGDFRDGEHLSPDLKRDLEQLGLAGDAIRLYRSFSELITSEVRDLRELQTRFALRLQREPEFREQLGAWLIAAADEDGRARLEPNLVNIRLLRPQAVEFGSFEPLDEPEVIGALTGDDHESYEVALRGLVKVTLTVEPQPSAATPVTLAVTDDVDVEYSFHVVYDSGTQVIREVRLTGVRSLATNILGRPRTPTSA
jgi:PIN domain